MTAFGMLTSRQLSENLQWHRLERAFCLYVGTLATEARLLNEVNCVLARARLSRQEHEAGLLRPESLDGLDLDAADFDLDAPLDD